MKAIILSAGLGSRLKDKTSAKPKALVEVAGRTMLESVILKLKDYGITEFLINIHHFGDKIITFLKENDNFGVDIIISDERCKLLNTGGAILAVRNFVAGSEPVLVHNVDVVSNLNIDELLRYHIENKCVATLCVRKRKSTRGLLFDDENNLVGWTNLQKKQFKWVSGVCDNFAVFAFSGIYLISPGFPDLISQVGSFSIIDAWLDIAKNNIIKAKIDNSDVWHDLGTAEKIRIAEAEIKK